MTSKPKVMVLGGGGFIGSHLAHRLVTQGNQVTLVDVKFPAFRIPLHSGCKLERVDLRDSRTTAELIGGIHPDYLFQVAADMGGVEFFHASTDWDGAANNNLINAAVMAAVAKMEAPPRVLFTGSACAYATELQMTGERVNLTEDDISWGTPDQMYGQEKRHSMFMYLEAPFDARVAALHTVYGPYQEYEGIRMKFPSAVCQKARQSRKTNVLEMFGDGKQIRSYLYISDAVDRLMGLMFDFDESPGLVNIGSDTPYSCDYVAKAALKLAHDTNAYPAHIRYVSGPEGVRSRCCDNTKARTLFNVTAPVTLHDGLARFIEWLDEVDPL